MEAPLTLEPATGDIGVGGREIGYMFGMYKKIRNEFTGVLTGAIPSSSPSTRSQLLCYLFSFSVAVLSLVRYIASRTCTHSVVIHARPVLTPAVLLPPGKGREFGGSLIRPEVSSYAYHPTCRYAVSGTDSDYAATRLRGTASRTSLGRCWLPRSAYLPMLGLRDPVPLPGAETSRNSRVCPCASPTSCPLLTQSTAEYKPKVCRVLTCGVLVPVEKVLDLGGIPVSVSDSSGWYGSHTDR
eukprot:2343770-Rhodomonas_salina.5